MLGARLLDLTLTTRDKGKEDAVPMCGVPHHAARGYIAKLTELGHRVVIVEQVEDPRLAKGLVKREVARIVTPGVVLDDEVLEPKQPRYLAAIVHGRQGSSATSGSRTSTRRPASCARPSWRSADARGRARPRRAARGARRRASCSARAARSRASRARYRVAWNAAAVPAPETRCGRARRRSRGLAAPAIARSRCVPRQPWWRTRARRNRPARCRSARSRCTRPATPSCSTRRRSRTSSWSRR